MRKFFTLSAAVLCSAGVYAQTTNDSRLVAEVNRMSYNGLKWDHIDSSVYVYSGNNGYDALTKGWKYDNYVLWSWAKYSPFWSDAKKTEQTIVNNRITGRQFFVKSSGGWQGQEGNSYTYKNGLIDSSVFYYNYTGTKDPANVSINQYTPDKLLSQLTRCLWNTSTKEWVANDRTVYHYNSNRLADTILTEFFIVSTATWTPTERSVMKYTGKLQESLTHQIWSMGSWVDYTRFTYEYDAKGLVRVKEEEKWNTSKSDWETKSRIEYTYNTDGDKIEEKTRGWNGMAWEDYYRTQYTYNAHRRLTSEASQTWDAVNEKWFINSWDVQRNYYYEAYTNDVKTVATNAAQLNVFPVPAAEKINIAATFTKTQPVVVSLTDMGGKIIKQFTEQADNNYRSSLSVSDVPAGTYILHISGTSEQAVSTVSISR